MQDRPATKSKDYKDMGEKMKESKVKLITFIGIIIFLFIIIVGTIGVLLKENILEKNKKGQLESNMTSESLEFSYDIKSKNGKYIQILIKTSDKENGLSRIECDNGNIIECYNTKQEKAIDYTVKLETEYKFKIISANGQEKEQIVLIQPEIDNTEPYIGISETEIDATKSVMDDSQTIGKKLYINFNASLAGENCNITLKEDESKTVPFEIIKNGTYTFIATGIYEGRTISKEISIKVEKYRMQGGFVQYDAGEWTEEEIEELQNLKLYDLNAKHITNEVYKASDDNGFNLTFGGYTYKGDSENENTAGVITSRNKSISSKYDGWRILSATTKQDESGNVICNEDGTERMYVDKIIHAGVPENFVLVVTGYKCEAFIKEYILSSGLNMTNYNSVGGVTFNARSWDMYKDKKQIDLIKNVHVLRYQEALDMEKGSDRATDGIRNIGVDYIIEEASGGIEEFKCYGNGEVSWHGGWLDQCTGLRPVVEMVDNVYIVSGDGTEENPYILGKE